MLGIVAISIVYGPPGAGKGLYLSYRVGLALRAGRPVFSSWAQDGARPLISLVDCLSNEFRNALICVDELGVEFDARQTMKLDRLVFAALTQHRKGSIDVLCAAQSPAYVDTQIRRVVEKYIRVKRIGPAGNKALARRDKAIKAKRPYVMWPWERPWAIRAFHYHDADFTDTWDLREGAEPRSHEFFWFTRKLAESYDTQERVLPLDLVELVREVQEGAKTRANLPPYRVERGKLRPQVLPDGYELLLPPKVSPKGVVEREREGLGSKLVTAFLQQKGIFLEDALQVVDGRPHLGSIALDDFLPGPARGARASAPDGGTSEKEQNRWLATLSSTLSPSRRKRRAKSSTL